MTVPLFTPIKLRDLTLPNRAVISPMCQYSAVAGSATDWHVIHLGHLALSGAGLLIIEATAVEPRGRITRECLGLYSDDNERALSQTLTTVRQYSRMPIGIQLGHAGRKASTFKPGDGNGNVAKEQGGWDVIGPSAVSYENWFVPLPAKRGTMDEIKQAFVDAARRADNIGIDLIEIHAAHGYLLSSFLSPIANTRDDEYGGSIENRMRFPLEVFDAVRKVWPAHKPIGVRFNGTDWDPRGITVEDGVIFAKALENRGCDYVDISSGGNLVATIPIGPGYQVPYASRIKQEVGITTMAVGLIRDAQHANSLVGEGQADLIALGRGFINDPRWVWRAAEDFGTTCDYPRQYARGVSRAGIPSSNIIAPAAKAS